MLCEPVHTSILIRRWSDLEWLIWPPDFFRAFRSVSSRTPVAEAAGARTQLTGVVGAVVVALLLLVAPNLLQHLPAIGLFEVTDLIRIFRIQRWEFWLSIVCLVGVAVFGAIPGIGLAIAIATNFATRFVLPISIRKRSKRAVIEFLWDGWRPHDKRRHGRQACWLQQCAGTAFGQPILTEKIASHFSVDEAGRLHSGFRQLPANGALHSYTCCAGEPRRCLGFHPEDVRRQTPVVDPAAPATSQISAPRRCRRRICKRAIESDARRKSAD